VEEELQNWQAFFSEAKEPLPKPPATQARGGGDCKPARELEIDTSSPKTGVPRLDMYAFILLLPAKIHDIICIELCVFYACTKPH
jgi:hypothetical protein